MEETKKSIPVFATIANAASILGLFISWATASSTLRSGVAFAIFVALDVWSFYALYKWGLKRAAEQVESATAENSRVIAEVQAENSRAIAEVQAENSRAIAEVQAENSRAIAEVQALLDDVYADCILYWMHQNLKGGPVTLPVEYIASKLKPLTVEKVTRGLECLRDKWDYVEGSDGSGWTLKEKSRACVPFFIRNPNRSFC